MEPGAASSGWQIGISINQKPAQRHQDAQRAASAAGMTIQEEIDAEHGAWMAAIPQGMADAITGGQPDAHGGGSAQINIQRPNEGDGYDEIEISIESP